MPQSNDSVEPANDSVEPANRAVPPANDATTSLALVRQMRFSAGHRLWRHEGKCAYLHGHNYRVDVEVVSAAGPTALDDVGRIVDFSLIKRRLLGWLDAHWDHGFVLFRDDADAIAAVRGTTPTKYFLLPWNPTAESMARYLLETVCPHVLGDLGVFAREVQVWETDTACAIARLHGPPPAAAEPPGAAVVIDPR